MAFILRTFYRFPVCCPVIYHSGLFERRGIGLIMALILLAGCVDEKRIRHEQLVDGAALAAKYPGDQG